MHAAVIANASRSEELSNRSHARFYFIAIIDAGIDKPGRAVSDLIGGIGWLGIFIFEPRNTQTIRK
jgi:hypothetical protein